MKPAELGAAETRRMGKPVGWDDRECGSLSIADYINEEQRPGMLSRWEPEGDDLAKLQAGAPIWLSIMGTTHPPVSVFVGEVDHPPKVPPGYTAETWAAKQAETAEFSRRDPFEDPPEHRKANAEARLNAAKDIQCADVPDQFALVRRGDLITIMHELIRHRAGHELGIERRDKLGELLAPFADFHGDLPEYDHPLRPCFESGIQFAVELLAKELRVEEWEICDGTEEFEGDLGGTLLNIVIQTWPTDEHGDWLDLRNKDVRDALVPRTPA